MGGVRLGVWPGMGFRQGRTERRAACDALLTSWQQRGASSQLMLTGAIGLLHVPCVLIAPGPVTSAPCPPGTQPAWPTLPTRSAARATRPALPCSIETGPHKHAIQQTFFLYVYEPGGNRIEVANSTARLILDPDYATIYWTIEERKKGQAWGLATIPSFHTHGTPMPEEL